MAEPLKYRYSEAFIHAFLDCWKSVNPKVDKKQYCNQLFDANWEHLELKERMSKIAQCMQMFLHNDFLKSSKGLRSLVEKLIADQFPIDSFEFAFIPDYIEKNGINHLEESLSLIEKTTQFVSCEFAIRPFIVQYEQKVMKQMLSWSKHPHASVRRLSSEGCRSRLPWAMALNSFKKSPNLILPILENLKDDPSLYVRKSVANNLNDISKDHPNLALKIFNKWIGKTKNTDWIVKHACRTLLKDGNPKAMILFGYADQKHVQLKEFFIKNQSVEMGSSFQFQFSIKNTSQKSILVRLEYGIYFLKANGQLNRKVFKISERNLEGNAELKMEKNHSIKLISTRKYYYGEHEISLIINGIELKKASFQLIPNTKKQITTNS